MTDRPRTPNLEYRGHKIGTYATKYPGQHRQASCKHQSRLFECSIRLPARSRAALACGPHLLDQQTNRNQHSAIYVAASRDNSSASDYEQKRLLLSTVTNNNKIIIETVFDLYSFRFIELCASCVPVYMPAPSRAKFTRYSHSRAQSDDRCFIRCCQQSQLFGRMIRTKTLNYLYNTTNNRLLSKRFPISTAISFFICRASYSASTSRIFDNTRIVHTEPLRSSMNI